MSFEDHFKKLRDSIENPENEPEEKGAVPTEKEEFPDQKEKKEAPKPEKPALDHVRAWEQEQEAREDRFRGFHEKGSA